MALHIDSSAQEASPAKASSSTNSARPDGESRHPEIILDGSVDSLCSISDEDEEGTDIEDVEEEDYEASRLRRIQENQLLLSSLGIQTGMNAVATTPSLPTCLEAPARKRRKIQTTTYDRSGYIVSLPNPGEKHVMACIELPSDRKLRKRIADGEYADCSHWAEGEERRWRFGDGRGILQEGEEVVVGDVGPDFRWRKWLGKGEELRNELRKRGELNDADVRGTRATVTLDANVSEYSLIPGASCHQCRRKSEKEKMRCRNTNPECNAEFCSSCCKRYSYFEFDPDSRSFICPLCMNNCNCSNCIRKRDLSHLLESKGLRTESLTRKLKREGVVGTVETYLKEMGSVKQAPFERVRLVCQEEDIISPELPPEPIELIVKSKKPKTKKEKTIINSSGPGRPKGSKTKNAQAKTGKKGIEPPVITFQVPPKTPQRQRRTKEIDSDGDTVGGYSDDEDDQELQNRAESPASSLSSAPSTLSATPPRRLAFPPRLPPPSHLYPTTSLAHMMNTEPAFIRTDMIQSHRESPGPTDEIVAVAKVKRKRPPPAASIVRAPSYMTNPNLARSHQNATASSSSSSSSSSAPSTEGPLHTWQTPALGIYHPNGTVQFENGHTTPQGMIHSSSPDPLSLPLPSFTNGHEAACKGKQTEKRIVNDNFLDSQLGRRPEAGLMEDTTHIPNVRLLIPMSKHDRDRDPLFPDAPLWYTYNETTHPSREVQ